MQRIATIASVLVHKAQERLDSLDAQDEPSPHSLEDAVTDSYSRHVNVQIRKATESSEEAAARTDHHVSKPWILRASADLFFGFWFLMNAF